MSVKLLVLDDEPWQLSWVKDLVDVTKGDKVTFVETYDAAKAAFDMDRPDLAIVDIRIGDVNEELEGATLTGADTAWVGLRFLRFIRVERNSPATKIMVYTGLDREAIQRIVEDAYQASFFTKYEGAYFMDALRGEIRRLSGR